MGIDYYYSICMTTARTKWRFSRRRRNCRRLDILVREFKVTEGPQREELLLTTKIVKMNPNVLPDEVVYI